MSGDTQPRKRKDKKRKKDDSAEQIPPRFSTPPPSSLNDDVYTNIHVHKDDGTGGGICAKIVFFLLFSALAVVIGLIITEHRGLTDLDAVDTESRFSQIFEGWTDSSSHDDHDDEQHIIESLEEHDDEEDNDTHETDDVEEHEDEDHEAEEEEEEDQTLESIDNEDEDEEEEDEPNDDEEDASQELQDNSEDVEDDDEDQSSYKVKSEEDDEDNENEETVEDGDANSNISADEENEDEDETEIKDSEEQIESKEQGDDDYNDEDNYGDDDEQEIEKDETDLDEDNEEKQEGNDEAGTESIEKPIKAADGEENDDQNNSRIVIKIGVGVALLVVAHVVLIRKWKSATPPITQTGNEEPIPDLSRRNTLVIPPEFQEVEQDIEDDVEEDYTDEDIEDSEDEDKPHLKSAKLRYQQLRTTYTRSLTPELDKEKKSSTSSNIDEDLEGADDEDEEIASDDNAEEEEDEEEEEESDLEKEDDDEDEELLKRLESKYGKLKEKKQDDTDEQLSSWIMDVEQDYEAKLSGSETDEEAYEYENITNKHDQQIRDEIDEAQKHIQNNAAYALKLFHALLEKYPSSPRTVYGLALCIDALSEQRRSNNLLQQAIDRYLQVLSLEDVPDALFQVAAERCINRTRFLGYYARAINVHKKLISRFPKNPQYKNQLAVTYLTINRINEARSVLLENLKENPNDGFALVHYGFILKTVDNKLNDSITYFKRGIATREEGVLDGRFYFHLGDALTRVGKNDEAMKLYEEAVHFKLFLSKYQRSLYNVNRLKANPWWQKSEIPNYVHELLEKNWKQIRNEGLSVLNKDGLFQGESENLKDTGDWKQFELYSRGMKNVENCKRCPFTCKIIDAIPEAKECRRGQTKFSVMHPGTHVWPHCGPTNCRLRVHLGLKVPEHTYIRVADETRSWKEGEVFVFDDSFEHEVWHNGTTFRLVLIVDIWHPELTREERRTLSPI